MNSLDRSDPLESPQQKTLVLIADDDRSLQMLLKIAMEQEGFEVAQSNSGEQCLRDYQRLKPDMVLLDAVMPGIDGFECCRQIRQLPGADQVPILMITVLDDADSVAQAFEAGATDYVTKPIYWAVLSHRVRRLLDRYQIVRHVRQAAQQLQYYQQWCKIQQPLLATVQTLSLEPFLEQVLQGLQGTLGNDRPCDRAVLYQVSSDRWLTVADAPENFSANLQQNCKLAPITEESLVWLQSQTLPFTLPSPEAIEEAVSMPTALLDSFKTVLIMMAVPQIQVVSICTQATLQAILVIGQERQERLSALDVESELERARLNSIREIIAIAFQFHRLAATVV